MKNIHLLPTDRPSRLSLLKSGKLNFGAEIISSSNSIPQHIYITSDEEIKEGEYGLSKLNEVVRFGKKFNTLLYKKIILTTDQDLINDGVQTIDDEFLEWFVNNANESGVPFDRCEVKKEMYVPQINGKISDGKITHELSLDPSQNTLPYYKIIIPKEEPNEEAIKEALKRLRRTPMTFVPDKIMYSEEEAFDLLLRAKVETATMYYEEMKEWFEQVKKK